MTYYVGGIGQSSLPLQHLRPDIRQTYLRKIIISQPVYSGLQTDYYDLELIKTKPLRGLTGYKLWMTCTYNRQMNFAKMTGRYGNI